jgi:hypothetical protein
MLNTTTDKSMPAIGAIGAVKSPDQYFVLIRTYS